MELEQEIKKLGEGAESLLKKGVDFVKENPLTSFAIAGALAGLVLTKINSKDETCRDNCKCKEENSGDSK